MNITGWKKWKKEKGEHNRKKIEKLRMKGTEIGKRNSVGKKREIVEQYAKNLFEIY